MCIENKKTDDSVDEDESIVVDAVKTPTPRKIGNCANELRTRAEQLPHGNLPDHLAVDNES